MSQIVRDHLLALIAQDPSIGDDPRRCEALLRDLCRNEHRKEITALVTAIRERVVAEIRAEAAGAVLAPALMARLRQRLHDDYGLREDVSLWTIETWAAAYGVPLSTAQPASATSRTEPYGSQAGARLLVQGGVHEYFVAATPGSRPHYSPRIGARVRMHFVDATAGLDVWQAIYYLAPITAAGPEWAQADVTPEPGPALADRASAGATFDEAPAAALSVRDYERWATSLEDHVYRSVSLEVLSCPALKLTVTADMPEGEFRSRVALALREKRDAAVEALRRKYASRLGNLEDSERRALQKVGKGKTQASDKTQSTALSVGGSLLGALFGGGRRGSVITKAASSVRHVSSASEERADVAHAEADAAAVREQIEALSAELEAEVKQLESEFDPATLAIETASVKPQKAKIVVEEMALVWVP